MTPRSCWQGAPSRGLGILMALALTCGCRTPAAEPPPSQAAPLVEESGSLERTSEAAPEPAPDERAAAPEAAPEPASDAAPAAPTAEPAAATSDSLLGLTRGQLRVKRGEPSERRAHEWVYTPEPSGCQELIISEVVSFAGDVVSTVRLRRDRTHKYCKERAF